MITVLSEGSLFDIVANLALGVAIAFLLTYIVVWFFID